MEHEPQDRNAPPAARPAWADLRLWQIQFVRDVLVGAGILGLLLLGERLSLVTVPLLLALFFAYLFEPIIARITRPRWLSRRVAATGVVLGGALVIGVPTLLAVGFGGLQGVEFARRVAEKTSAVVQSIEDPRNEELRAAVGGGAWLEIRDFCARVREEDASAAGGQEGFLGIDREALEGAAASVIAWIRDNARDLAATALERGRSALASAAAAIGTFGRLIFGAFLTAFFFFFVSVSWPGVRTFGHELVPEESRERTFSILRQMEAAIRGFVRGRVTIAFLLGVFYSLGFWLMGVPVPLILGPAIALVALIPYAAAAAMPVVMVLLWLQGHEGVQGTLWWILLAPIVWYQIGQSLDDYVLTPVIQGKSTDLDTPTILFASIAGGILLGFFGLLVAIPLAACAKILTRELLWPRIQAWTRGETDDVLPLSRD